MFCDSFDFLALDFEEALFFDLAPLAFGATAGLEVLGAALYVDRPTVGALDADRDDDGPTVEARDGAVSSASAKPARESGAVTSR